MPTSIPCHWNTDRRFLFTKKGLHHHIATFFKVLLNSNKVQLVVWKFFECVKTIVSDSQGFLQMKVMLLGMGKAVCCTCIEKFSANGLISWMIWWRTCRPSCQIPVSTQENSRPTCAMDDTIRYIEIAIVAGMYCLLESSQESRDSWFSNRSTGARTKIAISESYINRSYSGARMCLRNWDWLVQWYPAYQMQPTFICDDQS